ncbi:2-C-methyl-D-erythritol 4-phosphate cytidylyltransferase [Paludibacteraceae bacterium OttesenSCG-928-F17]|nr:2-C-methyl-D-erythritol 4-phosphate cytidylyltransferase [Paludibacteraceae bacterium OttesenSCG-928-F17]
MKKTVIIVAGGQGSRMNSDIPKQFIEIKGQPVLMHTIERFSAYDNDISIILVLPENQIDYWEKLCKGKDFSIPHQITKGGETRFHSVKNGLILAENTDLIAVHDGVRPFVSIETIARCFDVAEKQQAVIPVVDSVDSLRKVTGSGNEACNRSQYKLVQTPQIFNAELLQKAYEQEYDAVFTDDASVVEKLGYSIHLVEGNRENIKITTAFDLKLAECLI